MKYTDSDDEVVERFWAGLVQTHEKSIGLIQQEYIESQNKLIDQLLEMIDQVIAKADELNDIQDEIIRLQTIRIMELEKNVKS